MTEKKENLPKSNVIYFNGENKARARERLRIKKMVNSLKRGREYSINRRVECLFTEQENISGDIFYKLKNKLFSTGEFIGWATATDKDKKKLVFLGKAGDRKGYFFIDLDSLSGRILILKNSA